MSNSVSLLYDNQDGSQKQWRGEVDLPNDEVILEYGRVSKRLRRVIIPRARFSQSDPFQELLHRADKKYRQGYYDNSDEKGLTPKKPSPKAKPVKRINVLAALDNDEGEEWFF